MRKFIISGVGAIGTAALVLGVATPAMAVGGSVTSQVCTALPAQILAGNAASTAASAAQAAALLDYNNKTAALATSQGNLVAAVVEWVQAADAGGALADAKAVLLSAASADFGTKAAAWSGAWSAKDAADRAATLAVMIPNILNGVGAGLCSIS